jgi:hypothetical protein
MTAREGERKQRWTRLLDQILNPIATFEAEHDRRRPSPEDKLGPGRRLQQVYRSEASLLDTLDDEKRKALGLYLYHKRRRWYALWEEAADRITACEAEHVSSAPTEAEWAAAAAMHVRRRLTHFLREVQIKHPDMPDIEIRPDKTGRYSAVMSAVDALEALYFDIYESENNYIDRATCDIERERRIVARERTREWIDFRASGGVDE